MNSLHNKKPDAGRKVSEKRQYPRLKVQLPVRFSSDLGTERTEFKHGNTENISAGGLLLRCFGLDRAVVGRLIQDGSELCLRVKLKKGDDPLVAWGRVLRAAESGGDMLLVVSFTRMDPNQMDRIHAFMLPFYPSLTG